MGSDSIAAVPIPSAANTKNPGKKKRVTIFIPIPIIYNFFVNRSNSNSRLIEFYFQTNRSAKLKQYKIDARREQWLSQGMCDVNIDFSFDLLVS